MAEPTANEAATTEFPSLSAVLRQLVEVMNRLAASMDSQPKPTRPEIALGQNLAWSLDDIAALIGLSRRSLERSAAAGMIPPPDVRCGRRVLWKPETIRRWLNPGGTAGIETESVPLSADGAGAEHHALSTTEPHGRDDDVARVVVEGAL